MLSAPRMTKVLSLTRLSVNESSDFCLGVTIELSGDSDCAGDEKSTESFVFRVEYLVAGFFILCFGLRWPPLMVESESPPGVSNPMNNDRFELDAFGVKTDFDWFAATLYCGCSDAFCAAGDTGFSCSSSFALSRATFRNSGESPNGFWIKWDRAASVLMAGTGTLCWAGFAGAAWVLLKRPPLVVPVLPNNPPPPLLLYCQRDRRQLVCIVSKQATTRTGRSIAKKTASYFCSF